MCDIIYVRPLNCHIKNVGDFQKKFGVDLGPYGSDGSYLTLQCCFCDIDLEKFFEDNPQYNARLENEVWGDWIVETFPPQTGKPE